MIRAMLLGERQGMDGDVKRMYQLNGIAHILAISALHIAIIGMTLYRRTQGHQHPDVQAGMSGHRPQPGLPNAGAGFFAPHRLGKAYCPHRRTGLPAAGHGLPHGAHARHHAHHA